MAVHSDIASTSTAAHGFSLRLVILSPPSSWLSICIANGTLNAIYYPIQYIAKPRITLVSDLVVYLA